MDYKVQRILPIPLSILGSCGVVATSIIVAKKAETANEKIRQAFKISKKDGVKVFLKEYWPALTMGSATIASIVSGTIISKKVEASLSATAIMLERSLMKYKGKAKELFGEKASEITKSIAKTDYKKDEKKLPTNDENGERLYWEEHIGFFKATPENIYKALLLLNEHIICNTQNFYSFKVFLKEAKAKLVDSEVDNISYEYGWSCEYIDEVYEGERGPFLHIKIEPFVDEDGVVKYYTIMFDKDPIVATTKEKMADYNVDEIEMFEHRDEDAAAILYDELKDLKKGK